MALPGVQGAAPLLSPPFGGMSGWDTRYLLDGQAPEEESRQPLLSLEIASPAFFQTLGIEIVRGRAFTDEDGAGGRPVAILSESAARLAWPDKDAVGERVKIAGTWTTVVGVAVLRPGFLPDAPPASIRSRLFARGEPAAHSSPGA